MYGFINEKEFPEPVEAVVNACVWAPPDTIEIPVVLVPVFSPVPSSLLATVEPTPLDTVSSVDKECAWPGSVTLCMCAPSESVVPVCVCVCVCVYLFSWVVRLIIINKNLILQ